MVESHLLCFKVKCSLLVMKNGKSLLKEAGISDEIKIGPAEVLAIKVGLAIPWNKIRLLRRYVEVIYSHASHDIQQFDVISGG